MFNFNEEEKTRSGQRLISLEIQIMKDVVYSG